MAFGLFVFNTLINQKARELCSTHGARRWAGMCKQGHSADAQRGVQPGVLDPGLGLDLALVRTLGHSPRLLC